MASFQNAPGTVTSRSNVAESRAGEAEETYARPTTRSEPTPPWTSMSTRFGAVA